MPVISIADKLAGGAAGASISSLSSGPGGTSGIHIRGISSINVGNASHRFGRFELQVTSRFSRTCQ